MLDRSDDARNWLKGAIRQVNVQKFKEATANGDTMSAQAPPIYNSHRREIAKQLRLKGTAESIKRALVFQMNGVAAGRPGEVATMSVDSMTWDPLLLCVVTTWPQIKTHKNKLIAISAGADRLICPIMAFATAYAMGIFKDHVFEFTQRTRDRSLCSVDLLHAKASVCIHYGARVHAAVLKLKPVRQTQSLRMDKNGRTQDIFSGGSV